MKISFRLNFTSYLVAAVFLVTFVLYLEASPQELNPEPREPQNQVTKAKVDAVRRTEPDEPDIGDREKRELEIRARQTIGKVIAAPDGSFFLYEWRRPYDWDKDFGSLPPNVSAHMQSWIYRVDPKISATDSKYLFLYESGASQWLGSLSPDSKHVCFYSLDDDNKLKVGVWDFVKSKVTWFDIAPDASHLDEGPYWVTNEHLVYRAGSAKLGRANLVRASIVTGKAAVCGDCSADYEEERAVNRAMMTGRRGTSDRGPDITLMARSRNGKLNVYLRSTPNLLALEFKAGEEKVETVFENSRLGSGPSPAAETRANIP